VVDVVLLTGNTVKNPLSLSLITNILTKREFRSGSRETRRSGKAIKSKLNGLNLFAFAVQHRIAYHGVVPFFASHPRMEVKKGAKA
jgi:hypothetical protein